MLEKTFEKVGLEYPDSVTEQDIRDKFRLWGLSSSRKLEMSNQDSTVMRHAEIALKTSQFDGRKAQIATVRLPLDGADDDAVLDITLTYKSNLLQTAFKLHHASLEFNFSELPYTESEGSYKLPHSEIEVERGKSPKIMANYPNAVTDEALKIIEILVQDALTTKGHQVKMPRAKQFDYHFRIIADNVSHSPTGGAESVSSFSYYNPLNILKNHRKEIESWKTPSLPVYMGIESVRAN